MNPNIEFCRDRATESEIANHLILCDASFVPALSSRVEISKYAHKICFTTTRFEAWAEGSLVGLVAAYCNDPSQRLAYITSVSVLQTFQGCRVALHLMERCIGYSREFGFECVELEVDSENQNAIRLYEKLGFALSKSSGRNVNMELKLGKNL
jgi:ribosomal protein S18 acetylase RimI-like enzyme